MTTLLACILAGWIGSWLSSRRWRRLYADARREARDLRDALWRREREQDRERCRWARALNNDMDRARRCAVAGYVDEQVFRFNKRKLDDGGRFGTVMRTVPGRRLTWRVLTAQDGAGFMGLE